MTAFVSPKANGNGDGTRWKPLSTPLVSELARRSQQRVSKNAMFKEIEEQIEKRRQDDGVVRLSELLAEQEQEKVKNGGTAPPEVAREEDEGPTPHLDEALNVLADLVLLDS